MKYSGTLLVCGWIAVLFFAHSACCQELQLIDQATERSSADAARDGQTASADQGATLNSPRMVMKLFLKAMVDRWEDPNAYQQALHCMDFSQMGPLDQDDKKELADQLYGLINRIEYVRVAGIPDTADMSRTGLDHYTFFPRKPFHDALVGQVGSLSGRIVISQNDSGLWQFSSQTVAAVPRLYKQMEHLPLVAGRTMIDQLESLLPDYLVANKLINIKYWQWIGIFLAVLAGVVVDQIVRLILMLTVTRIAVRSRITVNAENTKRTIRPIGLLAASILWLMLIQLLGLTGRMAFDIIHAAVVIFAIAAATLAAWRLTDLVAEILITKAARTKTRFDDVLIPLLRKTVKIFIVIYGVIYIAQSLDIPIGPMLASLGISSLALAFAAKDTVENFFGSIAVLLDRPFDVGDWVVVDGHEGIIEEVGFRSTRIRTFYNSQVTMPNSNLVRATVDNYGRRRYRRWKTMIGVQYDTPPDRMIAFVEGIRELVRSHPYTRKDYYQVYFNEFGPSSLNILLYIFHEVPDWSTELRERERMFVDIVRLADRLGVSFAFPTQTIHLFQEEHKPARTQYQAPAHNSDQQATTTGIQAARELIRNQSWQKEKPGPVVISDSPAVAPTDVAGNPLQKPDES